MPLYEYQCDACGNRFERIRKFSDPPLDEPCPSCGGTIRKLISSPAIQFKGAGWYVNDYAKPGKKGDSTTITAEQSADNKSDSTKAAAKGDTKTDSKTDTKTESKTESKPDTKAATPAKS